MAGDHGKERANLSWIMWGHFIHSHLHSFSSRVFVSAGDALVTGDVYKGDLNCI